MKTPLVAPKAGRSLARLLLMLACTTGTAAFAAAPKTELPALAADGAQLPGKFVWADLVTDDTAAAQKFYGALLGWTFRDVGQYVIATQGDQPVAGLLQRERPKGSTALPRWIGYFSVPDVAGAQHAVIAGGGKVLLAHREFPKRGEQAIFTDPEGAVFGVIKSSAGDPADYQPEPGEWIWFQLLSHDARKAGEFYKTIGGYTVQKNTISHREDSVLLTSQEQFRAAVRTIPADQTTLKPTWLAFVRVKNVNASVALAQQLGGKTLLAPSPELFEGKIAVVADPTGGAIGLLESAGEALNGGTK